MLFPVKQLLENKDDLLTISKELPIQEALTLMIENDYSQLPVVREDGTLMGLVSEKSILANYYHAAGDVPLLNLEVEHACQPAAEIEPDDDIFEALGKLQNDFAVVVVKNKKPVGILTNYDTTHFFRDYSEGLILVEDIEMTLRGHIQSIYPEEQALKIAVQSAQPRERTAEACKDFEDLTLSEFIGIVTCRENWGRFEKIYGEKKLFQNLLHNVREIRNQLAHFRGKLTVIQYNALRFVLGWMQARPLPMIPVSLGEAEIADSAIYPEVRFTHPTQPGKYAPLEAWFNKIPEGQNRIQFVFEEIEQIIGEELPPSARTHRAWWGNDHTSHSQAYSWLNAGWLLDSVNISEETATFRRSRNALMQVYFDDLLKKLKDARRGLTQASKTSASNYFSFSAGRSGFLFAWVFTNRNELQVELYIDVEDHDFNKAAYDQLFGKKEEIETEIGDSLRWERLDSKRACRISLGKPALVTDPPEKVEATKRWAVETMLQFADTFQPRIRAL